MDSSEQRSENELIGLAQSGDREAFALLVRRTAGQIYNLAFRLLGNSADAEDLAQTAFVNAFKNISKFQCKSTFSTWVYKITLNLWKNKVKSEKRKRILNFLSIDKLIETEDSEIKTEIPDSSLNPAEEYEEKDKSKNIQKLLSELDEQGRTMIVLRDMEERSYEEISEITGCPLGTVKSRLARARETLRQKFLTDKQSSAG